MSTLPATITLQADEEARRLWDGACDAMQRADADFVALCGALELGVRAAEIVMIQGLQPVKDKLPATIALELGIPDPPVDVHRDAIASPKAMQFCELLDLISEESLECVGPRLHRGWEDRVFSCRRSRTTAREALGLSLDASGRERLLLLAAYRNRIFRYPPPVLVQTSEIIECFGQLRTLMDDLLD